MEEKYIGDGVYVSFDGYNIWLSVNHHTNKVVALEKEVFNELVKYANKVYSDDNRN